MLDICYFPLYLNTPPRSRKLVIYFQYIDCRDRDRKTKQLDAFLYKVCVDINCMKTSVLSVAFKPAHNVHYHTI